MADWQFMQVHRSRGQSLGSVWHLFTVRDLLGSSKSSRLGRRLFSRARRLRSMHDLDPFLRLRNLRGFCYANW